jgi:hypothetical protein
VGDRESFFEDALADLGDSPWARVIARAAPREATVASSRTKAPGPNATAVIPGAVVAKPQTAALEPEAATVEPEAATVEPEAATVELQSATQEPVASPASPEPRGFPGLPPDSPLSEVEFGMSHLDVRKILGAPDDRIDRLTAKAWIPFYTGPGATLREWIYEGEGSVVFSLDDGQLEVVDVVYDPDKGR